MSRAHRRKRHRKLRAGAEASLAPCTIWPTDGLCPLCARALVRGPSLNDHHLVPKSRGGSTKYAIHRVCHSKIHSVFSEGELAREFHTFEKLREHPEIVSFVKWVARLPPDAILRNRKWSARD